MILIDKFFFTIKNYYKNGFFYIFFGSALAKIVIFLTSILSALILSKESYAYLGYTDNIFSYLDIFMGLGLASALFKFTGPNNSNKQNIKYVSTALIYGSLLHLILSIILSFVIYFFKIGYPKSNYYMFLLIFYPTLTYILLVFQSFNRSMLKYKLFSFVGLLFPVAVLLMYYLLLDAFGVEGAIVGRYIGIVISLSFASLTFIFILVKNFNNPISDNFIFRKKDFFLSGIYILITSFLSMIIPINTFFFVNNFYTNEIITANFKIAHLIPSQLLFISGSFMLYYFPIISKKKIDISTYFFIRKIGFLVLFFILIASIGGIILTPYIFNIIFEGKFDDSINLSLMLWIVYAIDAGIREVPINLMTALGLYKINNIISFLTVIFHFLSSILLNHFFGVIGLVIALGITYLFSGITLWIMLKLKLKL